jgi:GT2 family glycosyltransferase/glycosyltransferase involved in cell wall biosynthesis
MDSGNGRTGKRTATAKRAATGRRTSKPAVAVVVVTFDALPDTTACVESLLAGTYPNQTVAVVDNGSSGEAEALRARFGDAIETLAMGRNLGYGAGANVGIRHALEAGADYVWVLNNDTIVRPDTVAKLVAAMEAHAEIGVASPQISAPEGPEAPGGIWFAGGVVDLRRGETRHLTEPLAEDSDPVSFDFLTGCAPFFRAAVLRQVGLFWERLFLFWEDTDLDLRVRRAGWTACVVPDARLHHAIHGSTSHGVVAYYHFRNALLVAWRHGGTRTALRAATHLSVEVARRWPRAMLRRCPTPTSETRGLLAGLLTALRWTVRAPVDARLPRPKRPIRVLHVSRRFMPMLGGTETYIRDLAEAQSREGMQVRVLTLDHDVTGVMPGRLPHRDRHGDVDVLRLPGVGARRFAVTSRPWRLMREVWRADVTHLHDIRFMTGLACTTARMRGRPVILHTHGLIFHTQWAARLKRALMRFYFGPVLKLTGAAIVASSTPDRDALVQLVPYLSPRLVLLENAIRLERFLELPHEPVAGRVLAFGRVAPSKGLDRLLRALAGVPGEWHLWIAGAEEPDERARLLQIAAQLGIVERVELRGPYSDAAFGDLLAAADVAAFPSGGEGFGLALLEAMAAAVPVVVNAIPAHRSLVGPDLARVLTDFDSPPEAGRKLRELLDMSAAERQALGELERRRAAEYDIARLLREIGELYESLNVRR